MKLGNTYCNNRSVNNVLLNIYAALMNKGWKIYRRINLNKGENEYGN